MASILRLQYQKVLGTLPILAGEVRQLPEAVKRDTPAAGIVRGVGQTGWGGTSGGVPYVWSASHLADGRGLDLAPLLRLICCVAEDSCKSLSRSVRLPSTHESIKRGISESL